MDMNTLQKDVNVLSDNSEQQNDSMYSMLNKIESLLGNESDSAQSQNKEEIIDAKLEEVISDAPSFDDINLNSADESKEAETNSLNNNPNNEEEANSKIDLNRMASLLNGFNK